MTHTQLLRFIDFGLKLLCDVTFIGVEKIPRTGAAICATNHLGFLDPAVGMAAVRRADLTGWVADKHRKNPLYSYFINAADGIWINRGAADLSALRKAVQALKEGRIFGVAPEGTRSPTRALLPGKEGVAYLALLSKVPIYPVAVTGTEDSARDWLHLRKPRITFTVGDPFNLDFLSGLDRQEAMKRGTEEIMCRIAALLPEKYRGVYADHPRLHELLAQQTAAPQPA